MIDHKRCGNLYNLQTVLWGLLAVALLLTCCMEHATAEEKDTAPEKPPQRKELVLKQHYLLFPIRAGAPSSAIDLEINGQNVREFDAELASSEDAVDFWAFLDIKPFAGEQAVLKARNASAESIALIKQADAIPGSDAFYDEPLRPQFHFSQKLGWNNDPNGMVYHDGVWHLFFQHNPYGWKWGNMHWGHAVSDDLVHWRELPIAIYNKARGDYAFSGGAMVDEKNSAGWQQGDTPPIVASWTSTGRGECLAYSNDRGDTFTEYEGNPVIKHAGRDPKIIWYEPGGHWVMAVYDESKEDGRSIALYSSPDLKKWTLESKLKGYFECPELFELPVDGNANDSRWVILAADAQYAIGQFDGKTFTPEHEGKHRLHHGNYYASQTFSNAPENRRIQIGWAQIAMPGMPFNQTFSFPHELSLRETPDGVRLFAEPVREIRSLYKKSSESGKSEPLAPGKPVELPGAELMDIEAVFQIGTATAVGLEIGGERVLYDVEKEKLGDATLKPVDGKISIRVLLDRPMMEVIGGGGRVYITQPRKGPTTPKQVRAFAEGGQAVLESFSVRELDSIWENRPEYRLGKKNHPKSRRQKYRQRKKIARP